MRSEGGIANPAIDADESAEAVVAGTHRVPTPSIPLKPFLMVPKSLQRLGLTAWSRLLLATLIDTARGRDWVSVSTRWLAEELGTQQTTICRNLHALCESGLVSVEKGGRGRADTFRLIGLVRTDSLEVNTKGGHFVGSAPGEVNTERGHFEPSASAEVNTKGGHPVNTDVLTSEHKEGAQVNTKRGHTLDKTTRPIPDSDDPAGLAGLLAEQAGEPPTSPVVAALKRAGIRPPALGELAALHGIAAADIANEWSQSQSGKNPTGALVTRLRELSSRRVAESRVRDGRREAEDAERAEREGQDAKVRQERVDRKTAATILASHSDAEVAAARQRVVERHEGRYRDYLDGCETGAIAHKVADELQPGWRTKAAGLLPAGLSNSGSRRPAEAVA